MTFKIRFSGLRGVIMRILQGIKQEKIREKFSRIKEGRQGMMGYELEKIREGGM